jgi:hypothetical protein
MQMQMEEARGYVFQALRQDGWNQWGPLLSHVGHITAKARNIQIDAMRHFGDGGQFLTESEKNLIMEVVWSLITQGILVPGLNDSNQGWPFLRLTEYGQRCVAEDRILPHDPDGYLRDFRNTVPNADPTVVEYLTESLQCYIHGLHRSAAVMLGGASEQAVLLMIESYGNSIADRNAKQTFQTNFQRAPSIFRRYELFEGKLIGIKHGLPRTLTDNVDSLLRGVFDLIRSSRNDAGHPAIGASISRDAVYSHLRLFPPYCKRIHDLIEWFTNNPTQQF